MNRKRLVLAALLALLVLSIAYAFWAMPRQEQAPPRAAPPRPAAKTAAPGKVVQPAADRLHLGLLTQTPQAFSGAKRDIFRFRGGWPVPVAIPVVSAPSVVEVPPPPPPPTAEQILQQQVGRFTFLGFLQKGAARTVFLSSGGEVFLVKAGDRFGKQQELLAREITATELVVGAPEGMATVRVKLVEKQPLKPGSGLPAAIGSGAQEKGGATGLRPEGVSFPTRRPLLQQRTFPRPSVPAAAEESQNGEVDMQPPDDGVTEEEPPQDGLPEGEDDGDKK